jgi:tRNA A-37 threonylcarbamoyl transferase component Bud32
MSITTNTTYTLISLSSSKPIFAVEEDPTIFGKGDMLEEEVLMQRMAANLHVAPPIYSTVSYNGTDVHLMYRIPGMSLADFYGVDAIPPKAWEEVRRILQCLWNAGIEYRDITPHNFMIETETGKIWVVDFGDAHRVPVNWVLQKVLGGTNVWNSDYT